MGHDRSPGQSEEGVTLERMREGIAIWPGLQIVTKPACRLGSRGQGSGELALQQCPMTTTPAPAAAEIVFDDEFLAGLHSIFEEMIVFNKVLGLKITAIGATKVRARLNMKPELIGHYAHKRIHGGAISASLDAMGGLAVMAAIGARHMDETPTQRLHRFAKLGTIDLRVDYLRPGIGEFFELSAEVMRLGSRVASTRMEFFGADGTLLSTGSAAYIVS
jgi:uncharacterized protein (TIGR00369 family)